MNCLEGNPKARFKVSTQRDRSDECIYVNF